MAPGRLLEVGGKLILQMILEKVIDASFVDFFIPVDYLAPVIEEHFAANEPLDMAELFRHLLAAHRTTAAFPIREYWLGIGRMEDLEVARNHA